MLYFQDYVTNNCISLVCIHIGRFMKILFFTLILVISMNGCVTDSSATNEGDLSWLNDADPDADANAALDKNDFRFMALSLRGIVIPGIEPAKMHLYELKCGVKFVSGVSDTVRSKEQLEMIKKARDYAKKYNAHIAQRCIP